MVKKSTKSKSKRVSIRKKHKIAQKVKAHDRKQRRLKRKLGSKRTGLKDPGIPASWPFREDFLKEMVFEKNRILQQKQKPLEKEDVEMEVENDQQQTVADEKKEDVGGREHFKDFKKVVAQSDVVLQVLDCRDPEGCRSKEVETLVAQSVPAKRLVFLLNKIDLVPRPIVESWLKFLRQCAPTIAFRSSTQKQSRHLGQSKNRTLENHSSVCLGADHLVQLLKNYTRSAEIKTAITVGLVGVPNVGKSSVINSLKRSRSAHVGNKPGVTTHIQEFHLDKQLRLLDSPGVIYERKQGCLQGVVRVEALENPVRVVEEITEKVQPSKLSSVYQIEDFGTVQEFLVLMATKMGKLKKGGVPDTEAVSKIIIQDWNDGKIPFYTLPPKQERAMDVQIVEQWAKDFGIDQIYGDNEATLTQLQSQAKSEEMTTELEIIPGGVEAFSKMAEIRNTKTTVNKTSLLLSEMNFEALAATDTVTTSSTSEPKAKLEEKTEVKIQPGEVRVLYRKGQKMSKRDKELYNSKGQFNPHRAKANKKQLKKKKKTVLRLSEDVATDLKL